jgi:hypothetical protein
VPARNLQDEDHDDDIHFDVASDVVKVLFKDLTSQHCHWGSCCDFTDCVLDRRGRQEGPMSAAWKAAFTRSD